MVHVSVRDDGTGIKDPARFLSLGSSSWNRDVAEREDPAGMGVFSLAGRNVLVTSRHASHPHAWQLSIPAHGWTGEIALELEEATHPVGTTISLMMPGVKAPQVEQAIQKAAAFYPLPVTANGTEQARRDFLADAIHVVSWNGSRIGVFTGSHYSRDPSVNFHGLTIADPLPDLAETLRGTRFFTKVDIGDTPALQLVLPGRKEFVANAAHEDLKTACRRAIYDAIACRPTHRLSFEQWCTARDLGIELPEAEAKLPLWHPAVAASEDANAVYSELTAETNPIIVEPFEPYIDQPLAHALHDTPLRAKLAEPHAQYEGYAWYDRLPRLRDVAFLISHDGTVTAISDEPSETAPFEKSIKVDAIELKFTITADGEITETTIPTNVAFDIDHDIWYDTVDHLRIIWSDAQELKPETLVDLLEAICFCASDDSSADSWDTQHERFLRDARKAATETLTGADAAICQEFRDIIARNRWILPPGRGLTISVNGDRVDVQIADLPQAA